MLLLLLSTLALPRSVQPILRFASPVATVLNRVDAAACPPRCQICEIQLNLDEYVVVKHTIHRLYKIVRCNNQDQLFLLVADGVSPF